MTRLRLAYLVAVHAVPVAFLLREGLTPLDVVVLFWLEGYVAILLNRVRLSLLELRGERPAKRRQRRRRRRRILKELAESLAGGALLYGLMGGFLWLAVFFMAEGEPVPWTVGSRAFWATVGWMALLIAVEPVVGIVRQRRGAAGGQLLDGRTVGLLLRFLADQVLLIYGAFLVVGSDAPAAAIVALIAVKTAVDIAGEWLGSYLKRDRLAPAATP